MILKQRERKEKTAQVEPPFLICEGSSSSTTTSKGSSLMKQTIELGQCVNVKVAKNELWLIGL
jgi:hypothetical protein